MPYWLLANCVLLLLKLCDCTTTPIEPDGFITEISTASTRVPPHIRRIHHNHQNDDNVVREAMLKMEIIVKKLWAKSTARGKKPDQKKMMAKLESIVKRMVKKHSNIKKEDREAYAWYIMNGLKDTFYDITGFPRSRKSMTRYREYKKRLSSNIDDKISTLTDDATTSLVLQATTRQTSKDIINKSSLIDRNVRDSMVLTDEPCGCPCVVNEACLKVKALKSLKCIPDNKDVPLNKLCDKVNDCSDGSDEQHCLLKVKNNVLLAIRVISHLQVTVSTKCFANKSDDATLTSVLMGQLDFLNRYNDSPDSNDALNVKIVKSYVNAVASILKQVSNSLHQEFCRPNLDGSNRRNPFARRASLPKDQDWSPKLCSCSSGKCWKFNCDSRCEEICKNKHTLSKWTCVGSRNKSQHIPFGKICDGRIDCNDAADESDCNKDESHGKFEANKVLTAVIQSISAKFPLEGSSAVTSQLHTLRSAVQSLQINIGKGIYNNTALKNQLFDMLLKIYDKSLDNGQALSREWYEFASNTKNKFVKVFQLFNGLKPSKDCVCKMGKCALGKCSNMCKRTCAVQNTFLNYACGATDKRKIVKIEKLCNGKRDCPDGSDEASCVQELCQKRHFLKYNQELQKVINKQEQNYMMEIVRSWTSNVTKFIDKALLKGVPSRELIQKLTKVSIKQLIVVYATETKYSKDSDKDAKFYKVLWGAAQAAIQATKICNK